MSDSEDVRESQFGSAVLSATSCPSSSPSTSTAAASMSDSLFQFSSSSQQSHQRRRKVPRGDDDDGDGDGVEESEREVRRKFGSSNGAQRRNHHRDRDRERDRNFSTVSPRSSSSFSRGSPGSASFLGRFLSEIFSLPWEKILTALLSAFLLYMGGSRIAEFQNIIAKVQLDQSTLKHELSSAVTAASHRQELSLQQQEIKLLKMLKAENKELKIRLDFLRNDFMELEKRTTLCESRNEWIARSLHQQFTHTHPYFEAPFGSVPTMDSWTRMMGDNRPASTVHPMIAPAKSDESDESDGGDSSADLLAALKRAESTFQKGQGASPSGAESTPDAYAAELYSKLDRLFEGWLYSRRNLSPPPYLPRSAAPSPSVTDSRRSLQRALTDKEWNELDKVDLDTERPLEDNEQKKRASDTGT